MRRILRIWPLYYIILLIGLLIIPLTVGLAGVSYTFPFPMGTATLLYIFFLPNLVTTMYGSTFLHPLWSIGVEEQFYLIWAPLVKFLKKYLIAIFITIIALRTGFYAYANSGEIDRSGSVLIKFITTMKFESMAIGGLGAYLLFYYRDRVLNMKVFNVSFQLLFLALIFTRILFHKTLITDTSFLGDVYGFFFKSFISTIITSTLFLWLLVNISSNKKSIVSTENKLLDFLGSISYGIYMYHSIIIFMIGVILNKQLAVLSPAMATIVLYSLVLVLTVAVSYISFEFIEKKFLKMNPKLTKQAVVKVPESKENLLPDTKF